MFRLDYEVTATRKNICGLFGSAVVDAKKLQIESVTKIVDEVAKKGATVIVREQWISIDEKVNKAKNNDMKIKEKYDVAVT